MRVFAAADALFGVGAVRGFEGGGVAEVVKAAARVAAVAHLYRTGKFEAVVFGSHGLSPVEGGDDACFKAQGKKGVAFVVGNRQGGAGGEGGGGEAFSFAVFRHEAL